MAFYAEIHQSHKSHLPQWNEDQNDALHMQVERQHGLRSGGEWRTGE